MTSSPTNGPDLTEDKRGWVGSGKGGESPAAETTRNSSSQEELDGHRTLSDWEESLGIREQNLENTQHEIDATLDDLKSLRQALQAQVHQMDLERDTQNEHMTSLLENMEPALAAEILAEAPIPLALEILALMNSSQAGEILGQMEPKIAAELVEQWMTPMHQD